MHCYYGIENILLSKITAEDYLIMPIVYEFNMIIQENQIIVNDWIKFVKDEKYFAFCVLSIKQWFEEKEKYNLEIKCLHRFIVDYPQKQKRCLLITDVEYLNAKLAMLKKKYISLDNYWPELKVGHDYTKVNLIINHTKDKVNNIFCKRKQTPPKIIVINSKLAIF